MHVIYAAGYESYLAMNLIMFDFMLQNKYKFHHECHASICIKFGIFGAHILMDFSKKNITPLLTHWNYISLALTHWCDLCIWHMCENNYHKWLVLHRTRCAIIKDYVKRKQYYFFSKKMSERQVMSDHPLCLAVELTQTHNHKLYQYITNLSNSYDDFDKCDAALRGKIRNAQRTKFATYRTINPKCVVHQVYSRDPHFMTLIPEYLRVAFTRMRLSSHRLRIKTVGWARLPREHHLCPCGAIQDEFL